MTKTKATLGAAVAFVMLAGSAARAENDSEFVAHMFRKCMAVLEKDRGNVAPMWRGRCGCTAGAALFAREAPDKETAMKRALAACRPEDFSGE